jgi:hypothetical protein
MGHHHIQLHAANESVEVDSETLDGNDTPDGEDQTDEKRKQ